MSGTLLRVFREFAHNHGLKFSALSKELVSNRETSSVSSDIVYFVFDNDEQSEMLKISPLIYEEDCTRLISNFYETIKDNNPVEIVLVLP